jgi:hypothetical protein
MIQNLNIEQLAGIMNSLPVDLCFIDENDLVRFFNKPETRISKYPQSIIGKPVQDCHPENILKAVNGMLSDFKAGKINFYDAQAEIDGKKIHVTYYPIRNKEGQYLGTLELIRDVTPR